MNNPNDRGEIDELRETLYSRTQYKEPEDERTPIENDSEEQGEVKQSWDSPKLDEMLMAERRKQSDNSFMHKLFIVALVFFIAAIGIALYMFLGGASFISSKNVDITVQGPTNIAAGEIMELDVTVTNKNNADLEVTNLSITYPQGTRNPEDTTQSLTYEREELGRLGAGQEVSRTSRAMIFGERGEVKEIKFTVEYKVTGSSATFYKNKVYEVSIGDTPVVMNVSMPDEVSSGEPFTATIDLSANSPEVIRNVMVRAEYPYGFSLISSDPKTVTENNIWDMGDIAPGSKKTIELVGRIIGENEEERTFRFYTGIEDAGNTHTFKTNLATLSSTIAIARPSLGLTFTLNGSSSGDYVAPRGQEIKGEIRFKNNLPDKLVNLRAEALITGAAFNEQSIRLQDGFYDSGINTITWNSNASGISEELAPGDEGQLFFNFASLEELAAGSRNQEMQVEVMVTGTSVEDRSSVTSSVTRKIKVASQVTLSAKALYSRGTFQNTGPIPPKAETPTSYTVVLNVGNTSNDVANSSVTAVLGQNVKWIKAQEGEDITYDEATRKVTWKLGTLNSGSGFSSQGREASFQVYLTPSLSQVGTVPVLVGSIAFTGTDTFTSRTITTNAPTLTTRLSFDPTYVQGDEVVVK